jgi:hypothetical protein
MNHTFETFAAPSSGPIVITEQVSKASKPETDAVNPAPIICTEQEHLLGNSVSEKIAPPTSPPRAGNASVSSAPAHIGQLFPSQPSPQSLLPSLQDTCHTHHTSTALFSSGSSRPTTELAQKASVPEAFSKTPGTSDAPVAGTAAAPRTTSTTLEGVHDLLASIREALSGVKSRDVSSDQAKQQQQADPASSASYMSASSIQPVAKTTPPVFSGSAPPQTQDFAASNTVQSEDAKRVNTPDSVVRGHNVGSYLSGLGLGKPSDMRSSFNDVGSVSSSNNNNLTSLDWMKDRPGVTAEAAAKPGASSGDSVKQETSMRLSFRNDAISSGVSNTSLWSSRNDDSQAQPSLKPQLSSATDAVQAGVEAAKGDIFARQSIYSSLHASRGSRHGMDDAGTLAGYADKVTTSDYGTQNIATAETVGRAELPESGGVGDEQKKSRIISIGRTEGWDSYHPPRSNNAQVGLSLHVGL